ncbi:hypothetical protein [Methylibium petroleiphilum]|uniref:Uncharacterized protein n=1 Tax=Methylibium petroleiphilum (strain ATCC BAA-1232 / LMG 22953 / PM1) TaxID=420662 RepID=A2SMN5_METPP|nr:hypothetical protein [Methylibium petroleiphilum]ABM96824.1 hypothetical protein Mpe_B0044 [Methylibium petroleiphilum PM1]
MTDGAPNPDSQLQPTDRPGDQPTEVSVSSGSRAKKAAPKASAKPTRSEQLFERFAHRARYVGDEETKRLKTQAKTVATGIRRLRDSFEKLMTAKQLDALTLAVRTLHELAEEADQASVIARKAKVDHDAEQLRLRREKADRIAEKRWGPIDDPTRKGGFLDEVHALVNFVDLRVNGASLKELEELFGGRHFQFDMEGGYTGPQLMRMLEQYEREPTAARLVDMRRRAAEYLGSLHQNRHLNQVNLQDYEAWSAKRRAAMPDLASIRTGRPAPEGQGS